jgi:hypothetical protein
MAGDDDTFAALAGVSADVLSAGAAFGAAVNADVDSTLASSTARPVLSSPASGLAA